MKRHTKQRKLGKKINKPLFSKGAGVVRLKAMKTQEQNETAHVLCGKFNVKTKKEKTMCKNKIHHFKMEFLKLLFINCILKRHCQISNDRV